MVPDEESLTVDDQIRGGEDNIAVVEQAVKLDDDSAVPEEEIDLNKVVPDENQWVDPEPVNSTFENADESVINSNLYYPIVLEFRFGRCYSPQVSQ